MSTSDDDTTMKVERLLRHDVGDAKHVDVGQVVYEEIAVNVFCQNVRVIAWAHLIERSGRLKGAVAKGHAIHLGRVPEQHKLTWSED